MLHPSRSCKAILNASTLVFSAFAFFWVGFRSIHLTSSLLNNGLDNDHLIVFDHLHQLFQGKLLIHEWVFSRLPSLFPDYFLSIPLSLLAGVTHPDVYLKIYWVSAYIILSLLLLCLLYAIVSSSRSFFAIVFTFSSIWIISSVLIPGFNLVISLGALPVNHGGNAANILLSLILFSSLLLNSGSVKNDFSFLKRAGILALLALFTFSNRLYLIQFLLPLLLTILILTRYQKRLISHCKKACIFLVMGGLLGIIMHALSVHQCSDPGALSLISASGSAYSGLLMLVKSKIIYLLAASFACSLFAFRYSSPMISIFTLFNSISIVSSLTMFLSIVPDGQSAYNRYLITPVLLSTVSLALFLLIFLHCSKIILSGTAISLSLYPSSQDQADAYLVQDQRHQWAISSLRTISTDSDLVLAVSPGWESRAISTALGRPGSVVSVSTDGNPMLWPHSREEYLLSKSNRYMPQLSDIHRYSYYIGAPDEQALIHKRLGTNPLPVECYGQSFCIWKLNHDMHLARSTFFANFFSSQADDRWRCLNRGSNPFIKLIRKYLAYI